MNFCGVSIGQCEFDARMIGYGSSSYGNGGGGGGGSSSYSSNLSALAPPFTVDRSGPKHVTNPLVDLTEPPPYAVPHNLSLNNWQNFSIHASEFDSLPSSNAYNPYSSPTAHLPPLNPLASASTDTTLYPQTSSSLVEAKPYYPSSYVSPPIGDQSAYDLLSTPHVATSTVSPHDDYTRSLSDLEHSTQWGGGLWEGLADWQQTKQPQLDGSLCSKENHMNQGFYVAKGMSKHEEISHAIDMVGTEKHIESASTGLFDYKSFLGENPKFIIPTDYSTTSTLASNSVVPETYPLAPSLKAVNSRNHQIPYNASYDQCSRKRETSPNDNTSVVKSSRIVVIRPPAQDSCSLDNMNTGNDRDDKNFFGSNSSIVKEPHQFISPKGKACFDANQLSFHLGQNDNMFAEFSSTISEELPRNKDIATDILDQCFRAKAEIQVPHTSIDCFNLEVDNNEAVDSLENCSESIDQYNPAVDSPCWKGAPVSHLSPFEVSGVVTPLNMKKLEACNGSNVQGHQIFPLIADDAVKVSPEKQTENSMAHDNRSPENCSVASFKRPSVANVISGQRIDDAVKSVPPHHTKPSYCHGNQIFDDIHEPCKENAMSNKSINNFDFKPSNTEEQSLEEGTQTSGKNGAPKVGVADVGMNRSDDPDDCSSHVPFHAIEHVLCSPPSAEDAFTKVTKSHGGESMPKLSAQMLVNTMHNLSELLLVHCSNDACELKEEVCEVLKDVINNLDMCILKSRERMASTHESLIPQKDTSPFPEKVSRLHKDQLELQHIRDKEHNIVSGKKDDKLSKYVSVRSAADVVKNDNMTQAIKKILAENFQGEEESHPQIDLFKNLWLETEASLCSVNYRARFNQMKIMMDKCNSQKANVMENLSRSKVSSDLLPIDTLAANTEGSPVPDMLIQESSVLSTNSHADDVMARFQILKCRVDDSVSVNTSAVEKLLSSKRSPNPTRVNKVAPDVKYNAQPDISIEDPLLPSATSHADDAEASVMARFHILKGRDDNSRSMDTKEHQPDSIDLGYAGLGRHWPISKDRLEDRILDVNMEAVLQNHGANSTKEKSTVKEFHLFVKDDPVTQTCTTNVLGDQPYTGLCDSSSLDWEHVLKEELTGQSC